MWALLRASQLKPAVPHRWLYLLSAVMWAGVGLMLLAWSWTWVAAAGWDAAWPFVCGGLLASLLTGAFFVRVVAANTRRIDGLPERACLFAFQSWWSYLLVVFMMGMGVAVKGSSMPRTWLAGLYLTIGGGLLIASMRYLPALRPVDEGS